jgi:hypothetical protein
MTAMHIKILYNLISKIFVIINLFALVNCGFNSQWYKPMSYLFDKIPENSSPGFKLGWEHGCRSGLGSQFGGAIYMSMYTWTKDADIMSSNPDLDKIRARYPKKLKDIDWNNPREVKKNFDDYKKIFWGSHIFCRHSVLGSLQMAGMDPSLPGKVRYDPGAHSLGNVWRLQGKRDARWGGTENGGNW